MIVVSHYTIRMGLQPKAAYAPVQDSLGNTRNTSYRGILVDDLDHDSLRDNTLPHTLLALVSPFLQISELYFLYQDLTPIGFQTLACQ